MSFIVPADKARRLTSRAKGQALDIFLSYHSERDGRISDRILPFLDNDKRAADKWLLTAVFSSLLNKTAVQIAPSEFSRDGEIVESRYYATLALTDKVNACVVFYKSGTQLVIGTVLLPYNLSALSAKHRPAAAKVVSNVGGQGRVRRAA